MEVRRLDPSAAGFAAVIKDIKQRVEAQETRASGNIVIRETLWTADPNTGVSAVFGQLPDGSNGFQPFVGDTTPPPVPTTPIVTAQSRTVIATWNGAFVASAPAPRDFQYCRIYGKRQSDNLVVLLGSVTNTNDSAIAGADVVTGGEVWTFWATSVDYNNNESSASTSTAPIIIASVLDDAGVASAIAAVQATANGKNTVTYSASTPSGSGIATGDVWFQTNASHYVIGQWQWSGSSWVQQTIDNALIANLDAGKIVTGYLSAARLQAGSIRASSGIIADINADTITSGTINASYIAVGAGHNALPDVGFNSTPLTNARTAQSTGGSGGWAVSNGTSTTLRKAVRTTASTSDVFSYLTLPHTFANAGQLIPCVAGQVWTFKVDTQTSSSTANVTFQVFTASADGTVATTAVTSSSTLSTSQRSVTATYTVPAGVTGFNIGLNCDTTAITWTIYGNAYVGQQVTGDLIVNGAIDGKIIIGATIQTASSGARIVLDTTSLNAWDASSNNYFSVSSASGVSIAGRGTNTSRTRTNYAGSDCSFESGLGSWVVPSGTSTLARDTAQAYIGTYSGKLTDTVTRDRSAYVECDVGSLVPSTFSVYVRHNSAGARNFRIDYGFYDGTFALIGSTTVGSSVSVPANTWTRLQVTTTTPPSNTFRVYPSVVGIGMLSTEAIWFDAYMFENGSTATSFFDGNTAATGSYTYQSLITTDLPASAELLSKNVTIKAGSNALWNPGNLTQALPGIGFVLDTPLTQAAGIFSDGNSVSVIEGNAGGAGGSRIDVGDQSGQHVSIYGWNGVSITGRGGLVLDGQVGTTTINGNTIAIATNGQVTTVNGRQIGFANYVEFTNTQTGAPNATLWGVGAPATNARSTNTSLVTASGGDNLTFNVSGIYTVSYTFHMGNAATGRSFAGFNLSYDSFPIARDEVTTSDDTCTATATVRVNAGEVMNFNYYQTSGGTTTVTTRIRITKISDI